MAEGIISDRDASRRVFFEVWEKYLQQKPLQPLEQLVLEVIKEHPEYHSLLQDEAELLAREFTPDQGVTNPFLHMGMHITIREQVSSDRPAGVRTIFEKGLQKTRSRHDLEHKMMECLGEALWKAQRDNTLPDESIYIDCLKQMV